MSILLVLAFIAYGFFPFYHHRRGDMVSMVLALLPYPMIIASALLQQVDLMSFAIGWAIGHAGATGFLMILRGR